MLFLTFTGFGKLTFLGEKSLGYAMFWFKRTKNHGQCRVGPVSIHTHTHSCVLTEIVTVTSSPICWRWLQIQFVTQKPSKWSNFLLTAKNSKSNNNNKKKKMMKKKRKL